MRILLPSVLILLALVPAMGLFLIWRERIRQRRRLTIGTDRLLTRLGLAAEPQRRWRRHVLWLLALGSLVVAAARPAWGTDLVPLEVQGASVMLVLDVSNSMNAQDLKPSRLERAKLDLQELARMLDGREIALIVFAGEALIQFPLTTDPFSIGEFLSAASSRAITRQGTALEAALNLAVSAFDPRRVTARYIVVATDGESHDDEPLRAIERAVEAGVVVHTLGYGGEAGAPVPVLGEEGTVIGYLSQNDGGVVLSTLDELTLRQAAERSGGLYRRGGQPAAVSDIANAIRSSKGQTADGGFQSREVERFGIFVALAVLALTLEMVLPESRHKSP